MPFPWGGGYILRSWGPQIWPVKRSAKFVPPGDKKICVTFFASHILAHQSKSAFARLTSLLCNILQKFLLLHLFELLDNNNIINLLENNANASFPVCICVPGGASFQCFLLGPSSKDNGIFTGDRKPWPLMSSGLSPPVPSHFLIFGISCQLLVAFRPVLAQPDSDPINDNLAKIMSTSAFQQQTIRLPMALLLILLVLLAISTPNALGNPIVVRDMDEVDEPHAFQAVEKRRNAEFINGLLTMERLNAIGKRSPPVPDVDEVQQLFWRPQHPFFWTD